MCLPQPIRGDIRSAHDYVTAENVRHELASIRDISVMSQYLYLECTFKYKNFYFFGIFPFLCADKLDLKAYVPKAVDIALFVSKLDRKYFFKTTKRIRKGLPFGPTA